MEEINPLNDSSRIPLKSKQTKLPVILYESKDQSDDNEESMIELSDRTELMNETLLDETP